MIPKDKRKEKGRLIKSLSHNTTATGESCKVELVDRDSAKKELAKLMGWYPEEGTGEAKATATLIIKGEVEATENRQIVFDVEKHPSFALRAIPSISLLIQGPFGLQSPLPA
jgi:hypothetical protein